MTVSPLDGAPLDDGDDLTQEELAAYGLANTPNPRVEGEFSYSVRLVLAVQADDPEHARLRFIEQINTYGLAGWTYRCTRDDIDEDVMVQDGEIMSPEEFARAFDEGLLDDDDDDDEK